MFVVDLTTAADDSYCYFQPNFEFDSVNLKNSRLLLPLNKVKKSESFYIMIKTSIHLIIIDDDNIDNYISSRVIKQAFNTEDILIFTDPTKGLKYIKSEYAQPDAQETILFLDTNMDAMTGWQFLEHFEKFDDNIKQLFKIYILSASDDSDEIKRASSDKNVSGYIIKPLTEQAILSTSIKAAKKLPRAS